MDIKKIQDGDEKAIKLLAMSVSQWVYGTVLKITNNKQDAEEVIQDTILKILTTIIEKDSEIYDIEEANNFKPWAYKIAINKAKDRIKWNNQKKRSPGYGVVVSDTTAEIPIPRDVNHQPDQLIISNEKQNFLMTCIDQLPASQKEVLFLVKMEGHSVKDAAFILQTTPKAVESLVSRAKENLRKTIEKGKDNY